MLKGKSLWKYKNFSINSKKVKMEKKYCIFCGKYRKFKNLKVSYVFQKTLVLFIICYKCSSKDKNIFKDKESIEILKFFGLIEKWNNTKKYE